MFSKALLVALLSLTITVYAAPTNNNNNNGNNNENPNDVCFPIETVTVTATAISTAAAVATSVASSSGSSSSSSSSSSSKGGNNGAASGGSAGNNKSASSSTSTAAAAASSSTGSAASGADEQSSLTLDPKVIATGFENDGQDVPTAGQVASATSSNNFINFCLTVPNLPITNGQQITTGSCNPAPMGVIAATTNMPSSKFTFPKNQDTIAANQNFTVTMAISNLDTGFFVNADENYFAAPQVTGSTGNIQGHSHIVIEKLDSLTQTTPTDPTTFQFFKGLNDPAANGVLSATVAGGLPAGFYRIASINTAANHQPALVAVAQHGALDDMVYFTVSDNGAAASGTGAAATASASAAASATAASASASASAISVNNGANKGVQQKGGNQQNSKGGKQH